MKIGIIGAGMIGGTLGKLWVDAGHDIAFGTRAQAPLPAWIASPSSHALAHASMGTVAHAIAFGDVVVFAAPYGAWPDVARDHAAALRHRIVIDAANPYARRDGNDLVARVLALGQGAGAYTAALLPGARVVKAFNTVYWAQLRDEAHRPGPRLAIPIAGDDEDALSVVETLANDAGFDVLRIGPLARSASIDPGAPVYAQALTREGLAQRLAATPTRLVGVA